MCQLCVVYCLESKSESRIRTFLQFTFLTILGEGINKAYFPILVPVGVLGNILSFLVSRLYVQKYYFDIISVVQFCLIS